MKGSINYNLYAAQSICNNSAYLRILSFLKIYQFFIPPVVSGDSCLVVNMYVLDVGDKKVR